MEKLISKIEVHTWVYVFVVSQEVIRSYLNIRSCKKP